MINKCAVCLLLIVVSMGSDRIASASDIFALYNPTTGNIKVGGLGSVSTWSFSAIKLIMPRGALVESNRPLPSARIIVEYNFDFRNYDNEEPWDQVEWVFGFQQRPSSTALFDMGDVVRPNTLSDEMKLFRTGMFDGPADLTRQVEIITVPEPSGAFLGISVLLVAAFSRRRSIYAEGVSSGVAEAAVG